MGSISQAHVNLNTKTKKKKKIKEKRKKEVLITHKFERNGIIVVNDSVILG